MGIKTNLQILAEITGKILTGGRRTTAVNTRSVLTDLADSSLNKKDGGLVVEALTGYTTDLTPTDDKHFASKKYVDDNSGSVPDATESVKGKVELVSDAELDSATPPDNTATTPTLSPIALSLRGVYLLWKKLYSYFTDRNSSQITVFASNGGSGNTFVANGSPAFSGNLPTKLILTFSQVAGYVPTGASTLNVDGIGAVPLLRQDASNLQNGDIVGGHRYIAVYAPVFGYLLQGVGVSGLGVVGPSSSTNNSVAIFDGTTGKLLKDSGILLSSKRNTIETKGNATISSNNLDWNSAGNNYDIIVIDTTAGPVTINTISNLSNGPKKVIVIGLNQLTFDVALLPTKRIKGDRYNSDSTNLAKIQCWDSSTSLITFEWVNNLIDGNQNF